MNNELFTWRINMVQRRFEVTLMEALIEVEANMLIDMATAQGFQLVANKQGLILVIEGPEDVREVVSFLAKTGFAAEVGLIREIVDYEPEISAEELLIGFTPE